MKRVIGILLAGVLSLGLLAGCGGEKMSEEEKAYKAACKTFTYEELDSVDSKMQGIQVTGIVNGHKSNKDNESFFYLEVDDNKMQVYTEDSENYKDGEKVTIWGQKIGIGFTDEKVEIPVLEAKYIEKAK